MRKRILVKVLENHDLGMGGNEIEHRNGFSTAYIHYNPSPVCAIRVAFGIQDTAPIRGPEKRGEMLLNKGVQRS